MPILKNSRARVAATTKGFVLPKEGWNAQTFALHGGPMILALARVAKITQRKAAPALANKAKAMFKKQVTKVNALVLKWAAQAGTTGGKAPRTVTLDLPQNAELWVEAMNEVFKDAGLEAVATVMPTVQSIMAQGYSKTSLILGQDPDEVSRLVAIQSKAIARRITNISETTRERIMLRVVDSIESGLTVAETAAAIESAAPQIYGNRALTIARTELNNAWTKGTVMAMQESETITHVSVIGCEAREASSPTYRGESTCNIADVPIADADSLEFHPNHTGNIVPSRFRNEDGSTDPNGRRPPIINEWADRAEEQSGEG